MVGWNVKLNKGDYVNIGAPSCDTEVNTLEMVLIYCLEASWTLEYLHIRSLNVVRIAVPLFLHLIH